MATRLFYTLLALLAVVVAGAAPGRPVRAQAQPPSLLGMNTYFTGLERTGRDGEAGVTALAARGRQIGAAWAREELSWANMERDGKGLWQWSLFDRRLLAARAAGYEVVGMLLTTPRWARVADCGRRTERYAAAGVRALDYWCPPASAQDYADYVGAVVERYDGDGVGDAPGSPRVAAWQIWNEPNHWETWPGTPAEYAAILQAGYVAAKAADPTAVVATAGVYVLDGAWSDGVGHNDGLRFLDQAFAANPAAWFSFDALAVHPYMPDVAPDQPGVYSATSLWGRLFSARAWLAGRASALGGPTRPLWVSELGWSTCGASERDCYVGGAALGEAGLADEGAEPARAFLGPDALAAYGRPAEGAGAADLATEAALAALVGKTEQQQADYLVRSYAVAMAFGVQHLSWFQLEDKFDGSLGNFWEEAAIFRTGALGYAPKPAAFAYAALAAQLGGASFVGFGPLHSYSHVPSAATPVARFHLRFRAPDGALVDVIWRNAGVEHVAVPLEPGAAATLRMRDGEPVPVITTGGAARFGIGESPVYLRQSAVSRTRRIYLPLAAP